MRPSRCPRCSHVTIGPRGRDCSRCFARGPFIHDAETPLHMYAVRAVLGLLLVLYAMNVVRDWPKPSTPSTRPPAFIPPSENPGAIVPLPSERSEVAVKRVKRGKRGAR